MQRCQQCGAPMPLGYCTRPACAESDQREDKLREALAELVDNLDNSPSDEGTMPQRSATDEIDLAPMFGGSTAFGGRFCSACNSPVGIDDHVCKSCGHLLLEVGLGSSSSRLNLVRSLRGFPGQSLALPQGKCRLTIDNQGLAVVTRTGQRALAEVTSGPGGSLEILDFEGFGIHVQPHAPLRLEDGQSLRLGQQLLVVARSPLGTYPRAGLGAREDIDTRLAAPALRRAPWYIHRLLPNGSVGEMLPLVRSMTIGDDSCDLSMRDDLVTGHHGTFDVSDELHLHPELDHGIWVQAHAGQILPNASQIWIGDAVYHLERLND